MSSINPDDDGAISTTVADQSLDHDQHDPVLPGAPESRQVLGGVAALIATRLGVNPFWLRMVFVVLSLAGGLGIVLYIGLWLVLVAGADPHRRVTRLLGGAVIAIGTAFLVGGGRTTFVTGNRAVVAVLVGLAFALWQPRSRDATSGMTSSADGDARGSSPLGAPVPLPTSRPPRSMLGQSVLGLAVVTAAVGALIDQANGGRLHPEQWLGAAGAVCGVGMLVGVVWGRARWLILPAIALCAAGYVGGAAAERGISLQDRGQRYIDLPSNPGQNTRVSFGDVDLGIYGIPTVTAPNNVAVLVGDVRITVAQELNASIDLRWHVAHGSVSIDGTNRPDEGAARIGPAGDADVTVDVTIWHGDLTLWTQQTYLGEVPSVATTLVPSIEGGLDGTNFVPTYVTNGVAATDSGLFVLADGEAIIDETDRVILGTTTSRSDGVTAISTVYGTFQLLPRGLLLTPTNEVVDLQAWRAAHLPATTTTTATVTTTDTSPNATSTTGGSTPTTANATNAPTTVAPTQTTANATNAPTTVAPTTTAAGG